MSHLGLAFVHDKETRISSRHIIDYVWATNSMLITFLWNIIVIFWEDGTSWNIWANYSRRWLHLSHCNYTVYRCRHRHSLHTFARLEIIILPINHVGTIIFPEVGIIWLALQSWNREVLRRAYTSYYACLLLRLWCILSSHFHCIKSGHLNTIGMNRQMLVNPNWI